MKKTLTFLGLFLLVSQVSMGQYFNRIYGSSSQEFLTDGHNAYNAGNTGHFLIGPSEIFPWKHPIFCFDAHRTDLDGLTATGAPYFSNRYFITEVGNPFPMLSDKLHVGPVKSFELVNSAAKGFTVAGAYKNNVNDGGYNIFHVRLDPDGNADYGTVPPSNNAARYSLSGSSVYADYAEVVSVIESAKNPDVVYICGHIRYPGNTNNQVFVMKVDETTGPNYGNLTSGGWGRVYDVVSNDPNNTDVAGDIVESPFGPELLVVGKTATTGNPGDGFILRINENTGAVVTGSAVFFGNATANEGFTSIISSTNPAIHAAGQNFVVAGTSNVQGDEDFWTVSFDATFNNIGWNNTYDYQPGGEHNQCSDVIERFNPNTLLHEYYFAGTTYINSSGDIERLVVKTDQTSLSTAQFLYTKFEADHLLRIDQLNGYGAQVDGLTLFGSSSWNPGASITGWNHDIIKTYFNGVTGCFMHGIFPGVTAAVVPAAWFVQTSSSQTEFIRTSMLVDIYEPLVEEELCYEPVVVGGLNNAMEVIEEEKTADSKGKSVFQPMTGIVSGFQVFPNPLNTKSSTITMRAQVEREGTAEVQLLDMKGRVIVKHPIQLIDGFNQYSLELGNNVLKPGLYHLQLHGYGTPKSAKVLVTD